MEKNCSARRARVAFLVIGLFLTVAACEKRPVIAPDVATPSEQLQQSPPSLEIRPEAAPKNVEPATVNQEADSFASYIHFPKETTKTESAVQFYCDVSEDGGVSSTYGLIGNDAEFKAAVQTALDWGHFKPAKADGKPVSVYLGGTVLFLHQDQHPVIVVSLATAERERVGKLVNYVQPQLIGGLGERLDHANATLLSNRPSSGAAEVLFKIDAQGKVQGTSIVSEIPKGCGLGDLLQSITKDAHWTPAYDNGKPNAGAMNVVVNFGAY